MGRDGESKILFPTMKPLDMPKKADKAEAAPAEVKKEEVIDFSKVEIEPLFADQVDFDTFSKSDFRAVKIKACEAVKKSKKLLQFVLDDGTGGAELRIAEYNLYTICPPGCRLTVSLRGCALGERNGVLQIGLPPDAYCPYPTGYISSRVLLERLLHPTGERQEPLATPCEIARLGTASCGRLVRIDALRFRPDAEQAVPQTWEGYRLFEDAAGRTIAVYTSAYARFADREIPAGECSLTGVLEYGTAGSYGKQFILQMRDENDCTH